MSMVVDSYRFATGGAAFNPLSLNWHSVYWAGGPSMTGYADTDTVTTWFNETAETDASGGSSPVYQATTTALNDKPSVSFTEAVDYLVAASWSSSPAPTFSVVAVASITSVAASRTMFDGASGNRARMFISDSTASFMGGMWGPTTGGASSTTAAATGAVLWVGVWTSGDDSAQINGAASMTPQELGGPTLTGLTINARAGGGNAWGSDIAFVGIYSGDVTADGSWADFEAWVTDHYGITIA